MDKYVEEFKYESARCTVTVVGENGLLSHVYSRTRGQGHATVLLTNVIEWADKNGLQLHLYVRGYGGPVQTMLSNSQLELFYGKFGFVRADEYDTFPKMIRTKNTPYDEREN